MGISGLVKFDLTYPGHRISGPDPDWAFEIVHLLSLVEDEFICAVASYSMFEPVTRNNLDSTTKQSKYVSCLNTIYARMFVYSLNSITEILKVLKTYGNLPVAVPTLISQYNSLFGNLKHIRDSVAHIENRGRALDKKGNTIPATIIVLGAFNGRRFEFTGGDGTCYGVDISESILLAAQGILQSIINAYNWE